MKDNFYMLKEPIKYIEADADNEYPIRILRAYRENCNCVWTDNTVGEEPTNPLLRRINEELRKRAEVLDKAIKILEVEMRVNK